MRNAAGKQCVCKGCLQADSGAAKDSRSLRRACGTHASTHADASPGSTGTASRIGGRATGHSGTGGASVTRPMHFHLSGIGGSAMAPLAGMLAESGHRVTGSDAGVYPPASTLLDSLGIRWTNGFNAANLDPAPDIVVLGNALSRGNPEVEAVLDHKIPYRSLPQTLEEFFLPGHDSL